jgi:exosortase/archaeosortase family protein
VPARSALTRFSAWIAASTVISAGVAPNFLMLLGQALLGTFDSVFPAIPFVALLSVILFLRRHDLREVLADETVAPLTSELVTRLVGASIIASVFVAMRLFFADSLFASAAAVVLCFYGASLAINPLTKTIMFPYAAILALGTTVPAFLQWAVGEPLAEFSALLASSLVAFGSLPVVWQGTQFALNSKSGELVTAIVTPGCSSIISLTTFVGLLALIHVDMKRETSSTLKIAAIGVIALVFLNVFRISILVWVSYSYGEAGLVAAHNWIGYALFLGFYLAVMGYVATSGRQGTLRVQPRTGLKP